MGSKHRINSESVSLFSRPTPSQSRFFGLHHQKPDRFSRRAGHCEGGDRGLSFGGLSQLTPTLQIRGHDNENEEVAYFHTDCRGYGFAGFRRT
jgi:hypothetical protein